MAAIVSVTQYAKIDTTGRTRRTLAQPSGAGSHGFPKFSQEWSKNSVNVLVLGHLYTPITTHSRTRIHAQRTSNLIQR